MSNIPRKAIVPYLNYYREIFCRNWGKHRICASIAGTQAEIASADKLFILVMKIVFCLVCLAAELAPPRQT
jgi:hypothetical protein